MTRSRRPALPGISSWPPADPQSGKSGASSSAARTSGSLAADLARLSDRELVNVLVGRHRRRGSHPGNIPDALIELATMDLDDLAVRLELSPTGARILGAALECHRRLLAARIPARPSLHSPQDVAELLQPLALLDHERFICLPLNARLQLIGRPRVISIGDADGTYAAAGPFLRAALRAGASSAIAAHNHPSGSLAPSSADIAVTRSLVLAGEQVGICVLDHVIVGPGGPTAWTSIRDSHAFAFAGSRQAGGYGDGGPPIDGCEHLGGGGA